MKPCHAVALALVGCYLMLSPSDAASASKPSKPPSNQITVVGCWSDTNGSYVISGATENITQYLRDLQTQGAAASSSYTLAGETSKLDNLGPYVRISGTFIPNDKGYDSLGTIKVATVKELSVPDAKLSPSVSRTSTWRKYKNAAYGITYRVAGGFPSTNSSDSHPNFVGQRHAIALARFEIPAEAWTPSYFAGGSFAIYVAPGITSAATCHKFAPYDPDDKSTSELTHGIRYAHLVESSIPPREIHYYSTFQNGRCYQIVLNFAFLRGGAEDLGCALPDMDPKSLIKPILEGISFSKPEN